MDRSKQGHVLRHAEMAFWNLFSSSDRALLLVGAVEEPFVASEPPLPSLSYEEPVSATIETSMVHSHAVTVYIYVRLAVQRMIGMERCSPATKFARRDLV